MLELRGPLTCPLGPRDFGDGRLEMAIEKAFENGFDFGFSEERPGGAVDQRDRVLGERRKIARLELCLDLLDTPFVIHLGRRKQVFDGGS